jgi:hypothetical protein
MRWLVVAIAGTVVGTSLGCSSPRSGANAWAISMTGVGVTQFGMRVGEAASALGVPAPTAPLNPSCDYWIPAGAPPGLAFMVEVGRIVRVDVDSAGIPTVQGLSVGSSADSVRWVFPERLVDQPHKYDWDAGWRYLTILSPDSLTGLVFEVDSFIVRTYRAGLWPAVGYVERCR